MVTAFAAGIMNQLLPGSFPLSPHWVYPVFLVGFLVVFIAGALGFINRERRWLRLSTEVMIALITLANAGSAVRLVADILTLGFLRRRRPTARHWCRGVAYQRHHVRLVVLGS
jgi:hypothetical protein